jgi:DHA1 family bicyclomycin/chloramphenicol resistance-like MFS transporter
MAGVGLFAAVAILVAMRETHPARAPAGWRGLVAGVQILSVARVYLGYTLATAGTYAVFFAFLAAAPYLTVEALHQPAYVYGIWFIPVVGAFVAGTYCSTRLLNRFDADHLIRVGTIGVAITTITSIPCYFLLPLSAPLLFIPIIVISFIQGFIIPNAQGSAINVEPEHAGAGSGLVSFVQMGTGALVVQAVAQFADGTVMPMLAFMVLGAIAGLLSLKLIKKPAARV